MQQHLQAELKAIEEAGLYKRERVIVTPQRAEIRVESGQEVLNFCANNYLGLSDHPRLITAASKALGERGYGMSSVRFICGTQDYHKRLERTISSFFGTDDTILYAACFDANGGLFEPLFTEEDAIISDMTTWESEALRERKEEIPVLAAHFVQLFNKKYNLEKELTTEVVDILMEYDWPGNVRELENIIERLVVTTRANVLSRQDLPLHLKNNHTEIHPQITVSGVLPLKEAVEVVERQILEQAYAHYKVTREVAKQLQVDPSTVLRKAARYGIYPGDGGN